MGDDGVDFGAGQDGLIFDAAHERVARLEAHAVVTHLVLPEDGSLSLGVLAVALHVQGEHAGPFVRLELAVAQPGQFLGVEADDLDDGATIALEPDGRADGRGVVVVRLWRFHQAVVVQRRLDLRANGIARIRRRPATAGEENHETDEESKLLHDDTLPGMP